MAPKQSTRRQVLATAGTGALAATAGVFYVTDRAQAVDVAVTDLEIPAQERSATDAPDAITLRLTGEWQIESNVTPSKIVLTPRGKVEGSAQGWQTFDSEELLTDSATASGQLDLERDLLLLPALRELFPTAEGETATRTVAFELQAEVLSEERVIGSDSARTTFELTLGHEAATAELGFDVDGDVVLK